MKKLLLFFLLLLIPFTVSAVSGTEEATNLAKGIIWEYENGVLTLSSNDAVIIAGPSHAWSQYQNEITKIVINEGVDGINDHNFENYPNLEEVVFPKSMGAFIGDYAFYNCPKLTHVDLPIGFTQIGEYAFYGTGIEEVELTIFIDWVKDHAFNDSTVIKRPAEYDNILAAGTAGEVLHDGKQNDMGLTGDDTCYKKFYYTYYWNDNTYWKIYKDGTMVIWGSGTLKTFYGSRNPWGCYNHQITKIIYNDDKTGTLTKQNKNNTEEVLPNALYAIYSTKPVEEIMNNRIRTLTEPQTWDCRIPCFYGMKKLETIVINRGIEEIGYNTLGSTEAHMNNHPRDIYISKYVKKLDESMFKVGSINDDTEKTAHLEVSFDDYKNNNYEYADFVDVNGFKTGLYFDNYNYYKGIIANDIDDYYVSINDNTAPKEIEVNGVTLYLYETYKTNGEGQAKVSLPNDPNIDYYVKEIVPPEGFELDPVAYKIDMSKKNIDLTVQDLSIEDALSQLVTSPKEPTQENPLTKDNVMVLLVLFGLSIILIIYNYRKGHELL